MGQLIGLAVLFMVIWHALSRMLGSGSRADAESARTQQLIEEAYRRGFLDGCRSRTPHDAAE